MDFLRIFKPATRVSNLRKYGRPVATIIQNPEFPIREKVSAPV